MTLKYLLILFVCYLPVYLVLVFYIKTKIQGYTMRDHMVSFLATSDEPWRSIFNASTILYGGLSLALPISLQTMLGENRLMNLGAVSLLSAGTATVLVGFFPMDRRLMIHNIVGFFAFLSVLLTGIVFSAIFGQGLLFSPLMELINITIIGTSLLLGASLLAHKKVSSLLEWILFLCTIAWNFLLASLLLTRIF